MIVTCVLLWTQPCEAQVLLKTEVASSANISIRHSDLTETLLRQTIAARSRAAAGTESGERRLSGTSPRDGRHHAALNHRPVKAGHSIRTADARPRTSTVSRYA